MNLILIGPQIHNIKEQKPEEKYPQCFERFGKLKHYEMKLHVDPKVKPVAQPVRRLPYSLWKKVDDMIKQLEAEDIIERDWVSPIQVVLKGENDIRLVVDMRRANETIIRERHPIPTVEEVLQKLNGNAYFSELDFRSGHHQIV